jgi:hypothetical protein
MDITGDDAGVWMSYDELAKARDIQRDGARRLAQRHRWRRHAGNDGRARVLVPHEWLAEGDKAPRDKPHDIARDKSESPAPVTPDITGVVTELRRRAEAAEKDRKDAIDLAQQTVTLLTSERQRMDALRDRLDHAERELAVAQHDAQAAQQAAATRDQAEKRAGEAQQRADRAEARTDELREKLDKLLHDQKAADAIAVEALMKSEEQRQAEDARKARGRLRRAWDGWRGR